MKMGFGLDVFARGLFALTVCLCLSDAAAAKSFDVTKYGAVADGKTDNAKAFMAAWKDACQWAGKAGVYVPYGTFFLSEVTFLGPCKGYVTIFVLKGTLLAPEDLSGMKADTWIMFRHVDNLVLSGRGTLDGQGEKSWPRNDCRVNPNCQLLPTNIGFQFVKKARIHRIKSINSKGVHFNLFGCVNVNITEAKIRAPPDSPNTDGIKVGSSNEINIRRSTISTGDDCVAILSGSANIHISNVFCGPGHGISVGSLGRYESEKDVTGLSVTNSTFMGTSNGVRIKTWAPSVSQIVATNLLFQDLNMTRVSNPIVIDQWYCPYDHGCSRKVASRVQIRDVTYDNIWGTSASDVAVRLSCSSSFPCSDIRLKEINLVNENPGKPVRSLCNNAKGRAYGKQMPPPCL